MVAYTDKMDFPETRLTKLCKWCVQNQGEQQFFVFVFPCLHFQNAMVLFAGETH